MTPIMIWISMAALFWVVAGLVALIHWDGRRVISMTARTNPWCAAAMGVAAVLFWPAQYYACAVVAILFWRD